MFVTNLFTSFAIINEIADNYNPQYMHLIIYIFAISDKNKRARFTN